VIPKGKSKQFLRVTVDVEPRDVELLDELEANGGFPSKREIFLSALRLLSGLFRARQRGMRPQLTDPETKEAVDFDWQTLPQVLPQRVPRALMVSSIKEPVVRKLLACAQEMRDMDLQRVVATIAQAVWDPSGRGTVDVEVLSELIVRAYGKSDEPLLSATRDLLTQMATAFPSFENMLSQAVHHYRPAFDTRQVEQKFLSDQYDRLLPIKYPAQAANSLT
jgi:hypothetical protein